jgi:hypothetical protein
MLIRLLAEKHLYRQSIEKKKKKKKKKIESQVLTGQNFFYPVIPCRFRKLDLPLLDIKTNTSNQ